MNRVEFEALRDLRGKRIADDIAFAASRDTRPNLMFERIKVENDQGWQVLVNGTYNPKIRGFTFNFVVPDVGPICRIDVNGTNHPGAGRTHKHSLRTDDDPRRNLPTAVGRDDLATMSPRQVWERLCQEANITHSGTFTDPKDQ